MATVNYIKEQKQTVSAMKELKDYPTALSVEDVAQILRVSTKTVYKIIRNKEIPAVKIGREYRIAKSAVVDHLRNLERLRGARPQ